MTDQQTILFPKVSVVVPIYNGENDLLDLINCLKAQTYPIEQVEYFLVDNASSDRTSTIIQNAAQNFPQIHYLAETKIQSSYAARNAGIRASTGEIIAFTDADCRPQPQWLIQLIIPFQDTNIGIVAGEITGLPGKTLLEKYAEKQDVLSQKYTLKNSFCPYGQTANLAIRKEIFTQTGLFRPYLTTGGDADICWRIQRETQWKIQFAPNAIVQHRHRSTIGEFQSQWRRYGKSNRYLHELYGIDLMRNIPATEYISTLSRWILKEVPITSAKAILGKADFLDLLNTPLTLLIKKARFSGQQSVQLSETAKMIERLE
ncbi:glycosyltransferase [[Phormidium ambiguum] IAM M-71]|uniref:Glycosyltransferase n=1 Tax=[Phormidium ambiguum] IAM M-71 TaxID=454136 RepID=A0A1U7IS00_9CYAN|nr:glycosyltransferase [Phormidium ambiguum]OKH40217.1 glycosyltransferase [Phormidium ambiguum IAM M-71]